MKKINKALYCDKCSLEFDNKIVYDIHLSFVHKISGKVETDEKTIEIKDEDIGSAFQSDIKKPKQNIVNLVHVEKKPNKCSICDYNYSQKGSLKIHIQSVHEEKNT